MNRKVIIFSAVCLTILVCGCNVLSGSVSAEKPLQTPTEEPTVEYHIDNEATPSYPEYIHLHERDEPVAPVQITNAEGFAVSSSTAEATWAGMKILSDGGNAVDAAVAVAYTLGVTEPNSSGLGGGGFMMIYDPTTEETCCLDYYSCAGSSERMLDEIAIPGFVMGMETALERWGTISMEQAIAPALYYAEKGFVATPEFITRLEYYNSLRSNPAFSNVQEGDLVVQNELAATLRTIQQYGADAFYHGEIAEDIARKSNLSAEDLAGYQVYCRDALSTEVFGHKVYGSQAPTSGVTLLQMLKMADKLEIASPDEDTRSYLTTLSTVTQSAYAARRSILSDPSYLNFDGEHYLSDEYIDLMLNGSLEEGANEKEHICTTQFSVIDGNGLIVVVTNTLSDNWGSSVCVDGFYLNDSLSLFADTGKNVYEAGKRPRTFIAMAIVVGEDGSAFSIGSPGGSQIPRIVAPVIIDILKNDTDIQTAIDKARVFIDDDGVVCLETQDKAASLVNIGQITQSYYYSSSHLYFGCTSVVSYNPDTGVNAYADRRRNRSQALFYHYDS